MCLGVFAFSSQLALGKDHHRQNLSVHREYPTATHNYNSAIYHLPVSASGLKWLAIHPLAPSREETRLGYLLFTVAKYKSMCTDIQSCVDNRHDAFFGSLTLIKLWQLMIVFFTHKEMHTATA